MDRSRTQLLVVLLAASLIVVLGVAAATGGLFSALSDGQSSLEADDTADRPDEPSTTETVGYVEGYWYDDDLPVDERDDAALEPDELEAVVYRSMARVEQIRELTFEDPVDVEVISREQFQEEDEDLFADVSDEERLHQEGVFEALFMIDRDTAAEDEVQSLFGDAVDGYYDPATDEIVLVSDDPDAPETDEVTLGHELLHALQDQHFDLQRYDRETIDQDAAKNGLIEGDAVWVDTEYEHRCGAEWDCVSPAGEPAGSGVMNWGLYLIVFQPYDDGPDYVDHLLEDDGWGAVDAAYDEPPASSSEVIRPGDERGPADIEVEDRSNDEWRQFEVDGEVATETVGEVGMVSMFAADVLDPDRPSVIDEDAFFEGDDGRVANIDYDQPYTDGWAGDELVTYVHDDALEADGTDEAVDHTAYVWESEWMSDDDAAQFLEGYVHLLEYYDAEPVDERQDTYEIDDGFPGAYALEADDETVTIVRAPSVDALDDVNEGAGPEGDDLLGNGALDAGDDDSTANEGSDDTDALGGPAGTGLGSVALAAVVVFGTGVVVLLVRDRRRARVAFVSSSRRKCSRHESSSTTIGTLG
ncbi:Hvo_1808 family surface protein [Natrarchaeobaculum sulfurireducens]|uniref:Uncharacterized protein n=1 Tax=Natrarchaeobaculum sulfurireducens TaxID=2044521 RepID=A0A346PUX2_9EURY|nr:Hvo_1808 family surface protein [Natrarchaeobaculum sulfurireducens]AXR83317.1 hypothetical protein AArcMg_3335 [Natrarchaeobaculum sulfurireducens]